jgi:hypothetical protein
LQALVTKHAYDYLQDLHKRTPLPAAFNTVLQNQKNSLAENFESLSDSDAKVLATALGLSPATTDANRRARELEDELLLQGCLALFKALPSTVLESALEGKALSSSGPVDQLALRLLEAICDLFTTEEYESGAAQKAKKRGTSAAGAKKRGKRDEDEAAGSSSKKSSKRKAEDAPASAAIAADASKDEAHEEEGGAAEEEEGAPGVPRGGVRPSIDLIVPSSSYDHLFQTYNKTDLDEWIKKYQLKKPSKCQKKPQLIKFIVDYLKINGMPALPAAE